MIHIYDDVKCVGDAKVMGQYTDNAESSNVISYTNKPQVKWTLNTNSTTFVLGVGCLVMALFIAVVLCVSNKVNNDRN